MASTYMTKYRQQCCSERDSKVSAEEYACRCDISKFSSQKLPRKKRLDYLKSTGFISAFVGIFLLGALGGATGFVCTLIFWWLLSSIIVSIKNSTIDSFNSHLDYQIANREQTSRSRCKSYKEECEQKIAQEEKRYLTTVAAARKTYGGSVVTGPIVKWMCDQFEIEIKSADRGIYISQITAQLRYRVDADQVVIEKKLPHSGAYQDGPKVNFDKGIGGYRYHNLNDIFHQIGFSQALAKQIEFEILRRFPHDPVAPAREYTPKIKIDYDDSTMTITYMVANPNYRTQVRLDTGVNAR